MRLVNRHYTVHQIIQVFLISAFPVYLWAVVNLLKELPAWIMSMDAWELTGAIAYTLSFALFETLIVFVGVIVLDMVLLFRWGGDELVVRGSIVVLLASVLSIYLYLTAATPHYWRRGEFVLVGALFVASVVLLIVLVHRLPRVERAIVAVVDKVTVLSVAYVLVGFLSVLIVLIRNL